MVATLTRVVPQVSDKDYYILNFSYLILWVPPTTPITGKPTTCSHVHNLITVWLPNLVCCCVMYLYVVCCELLMRWKSSSVIILFEASMKLTTTDGYVRLFLDINNHFFLLPIDTAADCVTHHSTSSEPE